MAELLQRTREGGSQVKVDETYLISELRNGDRAAFEGLLDKHHASMVRFAMVYVQLREVAEEVAQETWLCFLKSLGKFEGRCSLKTWIFNILANRAKTRGRNEGRSVPFSTLWGFDGGPGEVVVQPDRFRDDGPWRGHWVSVAPNWRETPEDCVLTQETRAYIEAAIETLPPTQRAVIILRDIEGLTAQEICNILGVTETNQRVLLHRARSRVRNALEPYMTEG